MFESGGHPATTNIHSLDLRLPVDSQFSLTQSVVSELAYEFVVDVGCSSLNVNQIVPEVSFPISREDPITQKPSTKMASITKLSIIRLFELVIVCVLIGLHYNSHFGSSIATLMVTMGTIGGYLIILVGLFAAALMGTPVNRRVDLFFSVVGCVLFIIVGGLCIDYYRRFTSGTHEHDVGLAKGSLAIIEGIFFLADAVFTFRGEA